MQTSASHQQSETSCSAYQRKGRRTFLDRLGVLLRLQLLACAHCGGSGCCPICKGRPLSGGCPCFGYQSLIRNSMAPVLPLVNCFIPGKCPSCRGKGFFFDVSSRPGRVESIGCDSR
jgi:hypothetical protein